MIKLYNVCGDIKVLRVGFGMISSARHYLKDCEEVVALAFGWEKSLGQGSRLCVSKFLGWQWQRADYSAQGALASLSGLYVIALS